MHHCTFHVLVENAIRDLYPNNLHNYKLHLFNNRKLKSWSTSQNIPGMLKTIRSTTLQFLTNSFSLNLNQTGDFKVLQIKCSTNNDKVLYLEIYKGLKRLLRYILIGFLLVLFVLPIFHGKTRLIS